MTVILKIILHEKDFAAHHTLFKMFFFPFLGLRSPLFLSRLKEVKYRVISGEIQVYLSRPRSNLKNKWPGYVALTSMNTVSSRSPVQGSPAKKNHVSGILLCIFSAFKMYFLSVFKIKKYFYVGS